MVYCELGRLPLYVERQCKIVKYWTKLLNTENCILKGCYDDMFEYSCSKPNDKNGSFQYLVQYDNPTLHIHSSVYMLHKYQTMIKVFHGCNNHLVFY
jgi:hypothetical protein